jgi:hypothetical protein
MYDFVDEKPNAETTPAEGGGGVEETVEEIVETENDLYPEQKHTSEFSFDLHGKSHPDALYRAAGGEGAADEGRVLYGCPCCGRTVGRVLRVRATKKAAWMAVCAMCAASTLAKHPEALIGGVVRAGRRRRNGRGLRDAG